MYQDGTFIPFADVTSDEAGRFAFDRLPTDRRVLFRVGATHDEVFHPGARVKFDLRADHQVQLRVYDSIASPSPLIALRHNITIRTEPKLLHIEETILVSNPSSFCYVGEGTRPVTLRLHIPSNFERVTFDKEFYGRRFELIDGSLVTTIPWPPGERELQFNYVVPIDHRRQVWQRPLDLACSGVFVTVADTNLQGLTCNLDATASQPGEATFAHDGAPLSAGHLVSVSFGHLPVPWSAHARWIALSILVTLIGMVVTMLIKSTRLANLKRPRHVAAVR
jgi:hypothetical protein